MNPFELTEEQARAVVSAIAVILGPKEDVTQEEAEVLDDLSSHLGSTLAYVDELRAG
jgi:hypothetical protein